MDKGGVEQPFHRNFRSEARGAPHLVRPIDPRLLRAEAHPLLDQGIRRAARQPARRHIAHRGADAADDRVLQLAHASAPVSSPSTAAMVRFASSTLKALPSKVWAAASSASAAARKRAFDGACPRRNSSALEARHGFGATPPSAIRTSAIFPPATSTPAATETSAKA